MRILLPALALALFASAAHAVDHGVYLGAGVSQVKIDNVGDDFNTGNLNDFKLDDTSWKLLGGVRLHDNFAAELNYYDLGDEKKTFAGGTQTFRADGKAYGAFVVGLIPLPIAPVDLFAKAGLVRWESNANASGPLGFRF